jgi:hypothetical protein
LFEGAIVGPKRRTHFKQVPLDVIKKIIEENARQEKIKTGEKPRGSKKKGWEANLLKTTPPNVCGEGT